MVEKDGDSSGIARSKMKDLRNAYCEDVEAARKTIELIRRRYSNQLDKLEGIIHKRNSGLKAPYIDAEGQVILYDALEMMDLYISL